MYVGNRHYYKLTGDFYIYKVAIFVKFRFQPLSSAYFKCMRFCVFVDGVDAKYPGAGVQRRKF